MTHSSDGPHPLFTQVDVSALSPSPYEATTSDPRNETNDLLRQLVMNQDRQNELLEELVGQMSATQRQRNTELGQWKDANPGLARQCRNATETLGQVQTEFLREMTAEINEKSDALLDGGFMVNEFIDRFGPRLAHINGVLQVLSQLSHVPNPVSQAKA